VEFVDLYDGGRNANDDVRPRWRAFPHEQLMDDQTCRLDLAWKVEEDGAGAVSLSHLDQLSEAIERDLERALAHVRGGGRRNS
jgi:hypothetical protein